MDDRIPALVFGACLVVGGTAALVWHVKSWRRHRQDDKSDRTELAYYRRQFSRRVQATGLLVVIGILLPISDLPRWKNYPGGWAYLMMVVLGLTAWVMLLGIQDLVSTRIHSRDAIKRLNSLREKQRELEREIARIKGKSPNGRPPGL